MVTVIGGVWKDTVGVIQSINESKQIVTINVELFGRETPVEISFSEIQQDVSASDSKSCNKSLSDGIGRWTWEGELPTLPHRRCLTWQRKVTGYIKLQIPAGKATPAPPVGPALGQHGVNIVQFTKEFNARTADKGDLIIPVVITVYADRSFSFITKTPPAAVLLKKACNLKSGSGVPNKTKVATISKDRGSEDR